MEQIEKQFITSLQSFLVQEGKEICKEIIVMVGDDKDELILQKAKAFCEFFLSYKLDGVNTEKLLKRCKNYLEEQYNFHKFKNEFERNNFNRSMGK